jgi:hypothetical protein
MNATDDPMDRLRALGERLEAVAATLGLTMENFAVIPGREHSSNPVDMCQAVFSVTADNLSPDVTDPGDPVEPDVELNADEIAAFADLESMLQGDTDDRPSVDEVRDFLGDDD